MATYLFGLEGLYNYSFNSFSSNTVTSTMASMGMWHYQLRLRQTLLTYSVGSPEWLARAPNHFSKRYDGYKNRMPNSLQSLKADILVRFHVPLPPNLANIKTKFIRVPGPITLEYTVITETLPPSMPRVAVIDSKDPNGKSYEACTVAKINMRSFCVHSTLPVPGLTYASSIRASSLRTSERRFRTLIPMFSTMTMYCISA